MKTVYPDYYKRFVCSAGKCKDTCCAGWEIVIDDESAEKYANVGGDFGEKLRSLMTVDGDGDRIFRNQNGRCPFLNSENLCDIYINCGEDYLCRTCDMFPRFVEEFGSVRETGLGLGCPEAVKLIISQTREWNFISETDNELPEPNDIDPELYMALLKLRKKLFTIIFDRMFSFESCLANAVSLVDRCQELIDEDEFEDINSLIENFKFDKNLNLGFYGKKCVKILNELEVLSQNWSGTVKAVDFDSVISLQDRFRNIAAYYIYRYFLKAVFDYDALSKIKLCVFSCEVIARVCGTGIALEDAARIYSKEAEYSAENLETLYCLL